MMLPRLGHGFPSRLRSPCVSRVHGASPNKSRSNSTRQRAWPSDLQTSYPRRQIHAQYGGRIQQQPIQITGGTSAWVKVWAGVGLLFAGGLTQYCGMNQEKAPYSDRWRFMCLSAAEARDRNPDIIRTYSVVQAELDNAKLNPEIRMAEDHPLYIVSRRLLDGLLTGNGLDPDKWKLHIIENPDNPGVITIEDGHFIIFTGAFYTFKTEETIAALMSHALTDRDCVSEAEMQSYRWFKRLSGIAAANLLVTSFFAKRMWFASIPYAVWWAFYRWSEDARVTTALLEMDRNELITLQTAGVEPSWGVATWMSYGLSLLQQIEEIKAEVTINKSDPVLSQLLREIPALCQDFMDRANRMAYILDKDPTLKKITPHGGGDQELTVGTMLPGCEFEDEGQEAEGENQEGEDSKPLTNDDDDSEIISDS